MTEISPVLQRYPTNSQPSQIEPIGSAGGMSGAQFWRIVAPRGTLVLRRWPKEHPSPDRLHFIHAVLYHAAQRGIEFLPLPIATSDGPTFVEHAGHFWELTPWLPGTADYERSPGIHKLQAAMAALAQFHLATADYSRISAPLGVGRNVESSPPTSAISRRLSRLLELGHTGINELSRAITDTSWPDLTPHARQFVAALPRAIPRAIAQLDPLASVSLPLQPCIRDIWHDHVLFTGDGVTGLIDFGALDIDTPATDIARLLGSLIALGTVPFSREELTNTAFDLSENDEDTAKRGLPPSALGEAQIWRAALSAYCALRPLTQDESLAVFALDTSGTILAGCNWIRWLYIERRLFENHAQIIERFRRITTRLSAALEPRSGECS